MRNRFLCLAGSLALGTLVSACSDAPTLQSPGEGGAARTYRTDVAARRGGAAIACVTRVARTSGPHAWTAAATVVRFPAAELDPDGRTIAYRYRGYTPTNQVVAGVDCLIPATDAAISRMNRRLKVDRWDRVGSGSSSPGARLSVSGAGYGDVALLPVTGVATWCGEGQIGTYPHCWNTTSGTVSPTDGDAGDDGWDWGGSDGGTAPDAAAAFSEGPLAWTICVLGFVGSTMSVLDVADKFQTWHTAWQDALGIYALWQATVQNNADPVTQQLYEYQYKQARQRQEDALGDVHSATNMSYVTLGLAAFACGALALAPTP